MRYPWANVALFVLLAFQLLTGLLGLIGGSPAFEWLLRLHAWGGYAILALLAWKGIIIVDAFRRIPRLNIPRIAFLLLTVLLLLILLTGVLWPLSGYVSIWGFSLMTIHALASLALPGLFTWHAVARRFVFRSRQVTGRRAFLQYAFTTLGGLAIWQLSGAAQLVFQLPGIARRFTGSYETGSRTGKFPTVSWILDNPPPIDHVTWQLSIDGAVEHPLRLTYAQVERLAKDTVEESIDCTGGWYSTQEWTGIKLLQVLRMAGVKETARSVTVESVSGYGRRFSLEEAPDCLLALSVGGQILQHGHGFPIRLVAPGHRGYDWVKWVISIHVNETGALLQPPLPLQ